VCVCVCVCVCVAWASGCVIEGVCVYKYVWACVWCGRVGVCMCGRVGVWYGRVGVCGRGCVSGGMCMCGRVCVCV